MEPIPVVLAGARGHGRWHLENVLRLARAGRAVLAGVCELVPLSEAELAEAGLAGAAAASVRQSTDLADLLARTGAGVTIVCTPIHTHTPLALTAARAGSHVLLEKPPAPSFASYREMAEGVAAAGAACQIGFQSLGSHAITAVREIVAEGRIGRVRGIGAAGAWVRDDAYWARAAWSGRRRLGGTDVVDGVLTNPLAHALATALRLDGGDRAEDVAEVELELFRANPIEADDTSCVRVRTTRGGVVTVAATLCAERNSDPYVVVHGERGRVVLWYKQDRVRVECDGAEPVTATHPRTDLLENLLDHLRDGTELLVPPAATGAFMRVVEAVRTAPDPVPLPGGAWRTEPGERAPRRVVPGVDDLVAASAERLATYSELGAPWAVRAAVGEEAR
ncbi:Gfo/Idh/MocA family oxidoreductase [Streptomyces capparidis]